jgi:alanine racemase
MRLFRSQKLIRPDLQAHIHSQALLDNVAALKSLTPKSTKFCAVVKANAYGHGIAESVNILKKANVDFFAVSSIYEALHIAPIAASSSILILEPVNAAQPNDQIPICAKSGFHCVISTIEAFEPVSKRLAGTKQALNLHVNIESGMGRNGLDPELADKLIPMIDKCPNTKLAGVFTHFATADEEDLTYAHDQLKTFKSFLDTADLTNRKDVIIHAANSAATIKMPDSHFDMVRCGISMYGYFSRPMADAPIELKPVMKLQAPIVAVKPVPAGHSISYGQSFATDRDTIIAIVPLGYADGYWRCFSNCAKMLLGDFEVPVIGRVCMDQLLIDVTDAPEAAVGQMVTIIDDTHSSPCGAYALADLAGTICYEILICVHAHINRIVH